MENYKNFTSRINEINSELHKIWVEIVSKNSKWVQEGALMAEKSRAIKSGNQFWLTEVSKKIAELKKSKGEVKKLKERQIELQKELDTLQKRGPVNPNVPVVDIVEGDVDSSLPAPANFDIDDKEVTANVN